jgi:hypothetical protein
MTDQEQYMTPVELAGHYRTTLAAVRWWRHIGYGPRGVKIGKRVLYPVSEVCRFDAAALSGEMDGQPAEPAGAA